jgi:hypothetical protein
MGEGTGTATSLVRGALGRAAILGDGGPDESAAGTLGPAALLSTFTPVNARTSLERVPAGGQNEDDDVAHRDGDHRTTAGGPLH